MPNPRSKHSKQRKHKRRTHFKAAVPNVSTCPVTNEQHLFHRAYSVGNDLYYRGRVLIKGEEVVVDADNNNE
jgi:large subunit ribosomal protein L32